MLEGKIIRSFCIKLQKENNDPVDLLSLSQLVEEFLEFTLGKDYDFPIDPFQIAEQLGMFVTSNHLDYDPDEDCLLPYGTVIHHKPRWWSHSDTLYTMTSITTNIDGLAETCRTTLFYLIAAFLLHYEDDYFRFSYYGGIDLLRKMPKDYIFLNSIACFLAMPYHLTKKEILVVKENRAHFLYKYFRNIAGITYSHVVSSFQQVYTLESLLLYKENSKD